MYAALALSDYLPPVPRNTDAARQAIWLRLLLDDLQLGNKPFPVNDNAPLRSPRIRFITNDPIALFDLYGLSV